MTNNPVNKFEIYSMLGIPELWRYNGQDLKFYHLLEGQYVARESSLAFPLVSANDISEFIDQNKNIGEVALLKSFRAWVRDKIVYLSND
jgi:hypothetical protein